VGGMWVRPGVGGVRACRGCKTISCLVHIGLYVVYRFFEVGWCVFGRSTHKFYSIANDE